MEEYKVNDGDLIDLSKENLDGETLACIVRTRTKHPGVETKRAWLRARLEEGHVFRKLAGNGCAFLEYAPVETAWVPVEGEGYLYLYCLWVAGDAKGHGVGARLMESLIDDAKKQGKAGVCMLSSERQMAWLSDRRFAERYGFVPADTASDGYVLLALSLDGSLPRFTPHAKAGRIPDRELTVYYDDQCPFLPARVEKLRTYCAEKGIPAHFIHVTSKEQAKALPSVFNNWAVFFGGRLVTVNQIDGAALEKILRRTAGS